MRIQVCSDLHLELTKKNKQAKVMESLLTPDVDTIVLAGDICNPNNAEAVMDWFCSHYKNVVYVTGNHEYAGFHVWETDDCISALSVKHPNLYHLYPERGVVTIDSKRFLGGTLWYPANNNVWINHSNWFDFRTIKDFNVEYVHELNRFTVERLNQNTQEGDVIVTHMAPSYMSVGKAWVGNPTNCFFANNLEELILEKKPKLWIHGHMHDIVNYTIGDTKVIANPRGYLWLGEGKEFNPHLVLEI